MANTILAKIEKLQFEKRNLIIALEDFKKGYKSAFTGKVRKAIKFQMEIVKARLCELDRVLSVLGIQI